MPRTDPTDSSLEETLARLIATRGRTLLEDPRLLNALLRDLHPESPLQVSVLIEFLRSGQLDILQDPKRIRVTTDAAIVTHLKEKAGVAPRHSAWAIDVWRTVTSAPATQTAPGTPQQSTTTYSLISDRAGSLAEVLLGTGPATSETTRH